MPEFSLPRRERLRGKIQFDRIFTKGRGITSDDGKMRGLYVIIPYSANAANRSFAAVTFAPVVPKRTGNAVWRNRMRRLMKEVFRTEKSQLITICHSKGKNLNLIIMPLKVNQRDYPRVSIDMIEKSVSNILNKLVQLI